mgnify:CR=1 FL=1
MHHFFGAIRARAFDRDADALADVLDQFLLGRGPDPRGGALDGEEADPFVLLKQDDVDEGTDLARRQPLEDRLDLLLEQLLLILY